MTNPNQPRQGGDAPSSSDESGRGNSGEGKDPKEGLYPPSSANHRDPDAEATPPSDDAQARPAT